MFGFDEYLIADFEVQCQRSVLFSSDLVLFLRIGDCQLELLVKFIEAYYKVASTGGNEVLFRVD